MPVKIDTHFERAPEKASGAASPAAELVAEYFRGLAARGLGCTTNNLSIASYLRLPVEQVRDAKQELIRTRRLTGRWGKWLAIDGQKFGEKVESDVNELEMFLRRFFPMVCDARVVEKPGRAALGKVTHLIIAGRKMTVADAKMLADELRIKNPRKS